MNKPTYILRSFDAIMQTAAARYEVDATESGVYARQIDRILGAYKMLRRLTRVPTARPGDDMENEPRLYVDPIEAEHEIRRAKVYRNACFLVAATLDLAIEEIEADYGLRVTDSTPSLETSDANRPA